MDNRPNTTQTAIDAMREMVAAFDQCRESFNERFTLPELVRIWDAWNQCGWTFYPDQWADRQVREALRGIAPNWGADERPKFDPDRATTRRVVPSLPTVSRRPSKS
jgi:hypothetical protein